MDRLGDKVGSARGHSPSRAPVRGTDAKTVWTLSLSTFWMTRLVLVLVLALVHCLPTCKEFMKKCTIQSLMSREIDDFHFLVRQICLTYSSHRL